MLKIIIINLISMNIFVSRNTRIVMYLFVVKSSWKFCGKSTIDWIQRERERRKKEKKIGNFYSWISSRLLIPRVTSMESQFFFFFPFFFFHRLDSKDGSYLLIVMKWNGSKSNLINIYTARALQLQIKRDTTI